MHMVSDQSLLFNSIVLNEKVRKQAKNTVQELTEKIYRFIPAFGKLT